MGEYFYTAKTPRGDTVQGTLVAENEAAVLRALDERSLFPVQIQPAEELGARASGRRRVRRRDVGLFYGQLADLLDAGVPLLKALDSLIRSTVNPRLVQILKEVRADVADGKSLTASLGQFPGVFPPLHTAMIQAGERAGFLEDVLSSLSAFVERLDELRAKVLGAMIYPALLVAAGSVVLTLALIFFVPRFEPLLANAPKPLPTRIVFAMSHLLRDYAPILLLTLVGLGLLLFTAVTSRAGRRAFESFRLRAPVLGPTLRALAIARFCRILGTLLANGVPILQSLAISKDATGSALLADRISEAQENVREGKSLAAPMRASGIFPDQIVAMIAVAEEANKLDTVLLKVADTVERRAHRQVDQAVRLLEPVILCLVAMGIGSLALGLLLPIFTMASALGRQ